MGEELYEPRNRTEARIQRASRHGPGCAPSLDAENRAADGIAARADRDQDDSHCRPTDNSRCESERPHRRTYRQADAQTFVVWADVDGARLALQLFFPFEVCAACFGLVRAPPE